MNGGLAIRLATVGYTYDPKIPAVLRDYSAEVKQGSVFAVLGPNGRGKTTLLKLLLGALKPQHGSITINGQIAFVPQLFQVSFPYRVLDMVLMGRARQIGLFSLPSRQDEAAALEALDRLGLAELAERSFDELSGGQRQLVIFARALASGADILVLDEPTSALDLKNQGTVLEWIARLRKEGLTVIFTTHHPHHAHAVADQALLMFGAEDYVCGAIDAVLTEANLRRLYGMPLRQVSFEFEGRAMETLVPVFTGLRLGTAA
ncbi:iron complex transport system ATP-binding protein [Pollutimonas bauzanensis]|uniref:Iron complex transport system ATP-binding protein n=2 Tax=Pollutimonas bauzanensis TaxID=658167 RepID=A0A1M5Y8I9_9BURK|nr:iron complex transport system ATP-binding protein [Pollutimonas bauzanensis]